MKLLLVTNLFPTPVDPQRGIFTLQLARRLTRHFEITVVCPLPWFPRTRLPRFERYRQYAEVPLRYRIDDFEVHSPKYPLLPKISEKWHASLMAWGIGPYLRELHALHDYHLVNSQWLYPDSVATASIFEGMNITHVATALGCDVNQDLYLPAKSRMICETLHNCAAITVVAKSMKTQLIDIGISGQKIFVISNGIDLGRFKLSDQVACRSALGIRPAGSMLVYVGRLSEEKDVSTLLSAIASLHRQGISLPLYLVGSGPLEEALRTQVNQLGITKLVDFVGSVSHDKVGCWMGAADFICLPSLREGCPNVVLEALACGKPIIASRVGAIPDLVNLKSGRLFCPGDVADLGNALRSALATKWITEDILKSVQCRSWESAADRYNEAFQYALQYHENDDAGTIKHNLTSVSD